MHPVIIESEKQIPRSAKRVDRPRRRDGSDIPAMTSTLLSIILRCFQYQLLKHQLLTKDWLLVFYLGTLNDRVSLP